VPPKARRQRPGLVRRVPAHGGEASPRRRLLLRGADDLADADLLSLLIASGPPEGAGVVADRLLRRLGSIRRVASATALEIARAGAVSPVTAARLVAAFALGRRAHETPLPIGRSLRGSSAVFQAYHARLRHLQKERFHAVHLDSRNRMLREEPLSEGTLTASLVHPREVFGAALREATASIVLVHNHPSGDPEPSPEDLEVTKRLCAVGELVGIHVVDHVVIGDSGYVSFADRGWIPPP
jgi:DNA repair protein RadC